MTKTTNVNGLVMMDGQAMMDSREVAEMISKNHADLLRDIRGYMETLGKSSFALADFFTESNYIDVQGKSRTSYLLTKQGCEFVANKMTGTKGVLFTAAYITRFHEMEDELKVQQPQYMLPMTYKEAMLQLIEKEEEKEQLVLENMTLSAEIAIQAPRVSYCDDILNSVGTYTTTQIADDYGNSAYKMNKALHLLKIQYKTNNQWGLYIEHKGKGYVETETILVGKNKDVPKINMVWTPKGREFIYQTLKSNGILPNVEKD